MPYSRPTVTRLMALIGLVAINLAVARTLYRPKPNTFAQFSYGREPDALLGIAIVGLTLQFALWRAVRSRDAGRAFGMGFTIVGSIVLISFVSGELYPRTIARYSTGKYHINPGSPMYAMWHSYGRAVFARVPLLADPIRDPEGEPFAVVVIGSLVWCGPQLLLAVLGGSVFAGIHGWKLAMTRRAGLDPDRPAMMRRA